MQYTEIDLKKLTKQELINIILNPTLDVCENIRGSLIISIPLLHPNTISNAEKLIQRIKCDLRNVQNIEFLNKKRLLSWR